MLFSRKIYYCDKPLILTVDAAYYKSQHPVAAGYLTLYGAFPRNFRMAFEHLAMPGSLGVIVADISADALLTEIHKLYQPIDAGGGVVEDEDGRVLMIHRRGRWDLPKGKRDDEEPMDACALREVKEETGLRQLQLRKKICDTYHIYSQQGMRLLKTTSWYAMRGTRKAQLMPQAEEAITEARWVDPTDMGPVVFRSYEAIREVLHEAGYRW
jgi:8-oxo-dGTP pyrophosphatase MutT (NUDIX family)